MTNSQLLAIYHGRGDTNFSICGITDTCTEAWNT